MGIFTYRISGSMGHYMGSLLPFRDRATDQRTTPKFAQIYIYDPDIETRIRTRRGVFAGLRPEILHDLEEMMAAVNPFAREFLSMGEVLRAKIAAGKNTDDVVFELRANNAAGPRTHNTPTVSEVAAILVEDGNASQHRDLLLFARDQRPIRLFETHAIYDPTQYVLAFPYGTLGWTYTDEYAPGVRTYNKTQMPHRAFAAYRLFQKQNDKSPLHQCGRLFQQYCVDQRAKDEQEKLRWVASNERTLRGEVFSGVRDALLAETVDNQAGRGGDDNADPVQGGYSRHFLDCVGKNMLLPATFTGGPRCMYEMYLDAMTIVRECGMPDVFYTMTCSPTWEEIKEKLPPGQTAQDRPDIVARVWELKLAAALKDLDEGVLGRQVARVFIIEFQKRGLPHAHICVTLRDEDKPKTHADVDRIVSAELPDPDKNPDLYKTVTTTIIHDPCGPEHPNAPCMKNGKCSKGFPKPLCELTQLSEGAYPVYRRRRRPEGELVINGKRYDNATINRWVVLYNPYFSQKYDCHINVELCMTIAAIKYLFKYVYKGSDKIEMNMRVAREEARESENPRREPNEIIRYVNARYISPVEACLRIFEFPVQSRTLAVVKLTVHLPDMQYVSFRASDDPQRVLQQDERTMLTSFFELNASDVPKNAPAKEMLYQDIPKFFRWDQKSKRWVRYKKYHPTFGRLIHVSPRDFERFYMRVMLCHVKGPTSFENLRTVNGLVFPNYREAAEAAGFLDNDKEWQKCMREAAPFHMPYQLRQLFATILVFSLPTHVDKLWEEFYGDLSEDFAHKYRDYTNKDKIVKFKTLKAINHVLVVCGADLTQFPLPQLGEFGDLVLASLRQNTLIDRELTSYKRQDLEAIVPSVDTLNDNQRVIYDKVMDAVENPQPANKLFFVDGPGGTGKSALRKHILAAVRLQGKIAIACASSGIASLLLMGGRTAHSTFKIPLDLKETSTCHIFKQSKLKQLLEKASIVIWDEVPMMHRHAFEAVDRSLRDLFDRPNEPFRGKVFVLSGDFRQILPIVKRGTQADTVDACIKSSELWRHFLQLRLTENMRVKMAANPDSAEELATFSAFLLSVGEGRHEVDPDLGPNDMKLPRDMIIDNPPEDPDAEDDDDDGSRVTSKGLHRIVGAMYSSDDLNKAEVATDEFFSSRTILTTTNASVRRVNDAVTERLGGNSCTYLSVALSKTTKAWIRVSSRWNC